MTELVRVRRRDGRYLETTDGKTFVLSDAISAPGQAGTRPCMASLGCSISCISMAETSGGCGAARAGLILNRRPACTIRPLSTGLAS